MRLKSREGRSLHGPNHRRHVDEPARVDLEGVGHPLVRKHVGLLLVDLEDLAGNPQKRHQLGEPTNRRAHRMLSSRMPSVAQVALCSTAWATARRTNSPRVSPCRDASRSTREPGVLLQGNQIDALVLAPAGDLLSLDPEPRSVERRFQQQLRPASPRREARPARARSASGRRLPRRPEPGGGGGPRRRPARTVTISAWSAAQIARYLDPRRRCAHGSGAAPARKWRRHPRAIESCEELRGMAFASPRA